MTDKLIDFNNCVSIFQPNLQKSFATVPPIPLISGPTTTLFYSWAGSVSYNSNPSIAFGTIDRWRVDFNDAPQYLNRDQWIFWSSGTPSVVRVLEVQKKDIPFHWSNELPQEIGSQSPEWVKNLVGDKFKK